MRRFPLNQYSYLTEERKRPELVRPVLIDFLICGTQKGGTTALHAYLQGHPEICLGETKELHFFDDEQHFSHARPDYSRYHCRFDLKPSHKRVGEATPSYMYWDNAPGRIWEYNPNMRLIIILRNPIERAYSHWNMERSRGNETLSFWDAIQAEPGRIREGLSWKRRVYSYIDRGFYLAQLRRLWSYFGKTRTLILRQEDLKCQPALALRRVTEFLGVAPFRRVWHKEVHNTPYLRQLGQAESMYLLGIFRSEIEGLAKTLGWNCGNWL